MRKDELSINISSTYLGQVTLTYPDEVVFVFNPLYIDIQLGKVNDVYMISLAKVSVSTGVNSTGTVYEVETYLHNGHARVYISRLMELFFDDVRFKRSEPLYVNLTISRTVVWSKCFMCVWSNLIAGERFYNYGAFVYDKGKPAFIRRRIWFKNFPFTVSMFSTADRTIKAKYDGNPYDPTLFIHYPSIMKIINSVEDEDVTGLSNETIDGSLLEGAVYDKQEQVFYGATDENYLYTDWTEASPYMPGPNEYNTGGKARTDKIWALPNGRLVRYDSQLGDLVEIPYCRNFRSGIFEICPAITFPNAERTATYHQSGEEVEVKTSTFDETFDYTFWMPSDMATITQLTIDNSTAGHYLRWIDRFGMYQYFLFTKGKETQKNKLGSDTVVEDYPIGGMYFANHERTTHIEGTKTVKVYAVSLADDIYGYVQTIINSPVIDLYVGKTRYGDEMWVPVNIVASNHNYDPTQVLHDLEISFTMPSINAQSL